MSSHIQCSLNCDSDSQQQVAPLKLPLIESSSRSLVSSVKSGSLITLFADEASSWMTQLRRRLMKQMMTDDGPQPAEVDALRREVVLVMIDALQKDDRHSWMFLREIFKQLIPFSHLFTGLLLMQCHDPSQTIVQLDAPKGAQLEHKSTFSGQLEHYVTRLLFHLDLHKERLFDLQVPNAIRALFPKEMDKVESAALIPRQTYGYLPTGPTVSRDASRKPIKFLLPNGRDPYGPITSVDWEKREFNRSVTFTDLKLSLPNVAMEIAMRDSIWAHCLGTTALAIATDLPGDLKSSGQEPLVEVFSVICLTRSQRKPRQPSPPQTLKDQLKTSVELSSPMDGRAAVAFFTRCYHLGKIKYMFLNVVSHKHFRPYDLVGVPARQVKPEYYIFSSFGVLHVVPGLPAVNMSLADWLREAILYDSITKIPFFRDYVQLKMLRRWRHNVHFAAFQRLHSVLRVSLLHAVPHFGAALLRIAALCYDIHDLQLLLLDSQSSLSLVELREAIYCKMIISQRVLETFFSAAYDVVDAVCVDTTATLRECEKQVRLKSVFTRESLYLRRLKKEEKERHLRNAQLEASRLSEFIVLVDQMMLSQLIRVAQQSLERFVTETMTTPPDADRHALLHTQLVFTPDGELVIQPSPAAFSELLDAVLASVSSLLCKSLRPVDREANASDVQPQLELAYDLESINRSSLSRCSRRDPGVTQLIHSWKGLRPHRFPTSVVAMNSHEVFGRFTVTPPPPPSGGSTARDDVAVCAGEGERLAAPGPVVGACSARSAYSLLGGHPGITSRRPSAVGSPTPDPQDPQAAGERDGASPAGQTDDMSLPMGPKETPNEQYAPLNPENLAEKLANDELYQCALTAHNDLLVSAATELDTYCKANAWLNEIEAYCRDWSEESLAAWDGLPAFIIEQRLSEVREWVGRVRVFDVAVTTAWRVLHVDCAGVHARLVPQLEAICDEICVFVAALVRGRSQTLVDELNYVGDIASDMPDVTMLRKQTTMAGFALYTRNINIYKEKLPEYQERVDYIKSLYEMMRISYRQLISEEEKLESEVTACWDAFLASLQGALEFVNVQTPLIMKNLSVAVKLGSVAKETTDVAMDASQDASKYLELEQEARSVSSQVAGGRFIDPDEHPPTILAELKQLRERFFDVKSQLEQASKWKEAITGDPYDLDFLHQMASAVRIREELWKYIDVSMQTVGEWKALPFKNLAAKQCLDKLIEWQVAAGQLKRFLPPQDALLAHWYRQLVSFKQQLPLMQKLSHNAVKPHHWKAIFRVVGHPYYPLFTPTVGDLLDCDLEAHSATINAILSAAMTQFAISQKLAELRTLWQEKKFKLAKYIPTSVLRELHAGTKVSEPLKTLPLSPWATASPLPPPTSPTTQALELKDKPLFTLVNVEQMQYLLEDSRISLRMMLDSDEVTESQREAERWTRDLDSISEMLTLWHSCQVKWMYLLKIFEDKKRCKKLPLLAEKFKDVHEKFTLWMKAVSEEPHVRAVLDIPRGERLHRRLQGALLRDHLGQIIIAEDEILADLDDLLAESRCQFPRLYFLSDSQLVELLSVSRNPPAFLPFVRRCFPGVAGLTFELPAKKINASVLDHSLHADKLQVSRLVGACGEQVTLAVPLTPLHSATLWLRRLEQLTRTTLQQMLHRAVHARLHDEKTSLSDLMSEVKGRDEDHPGSLSSERAHAFTHWLLRYPLQCVIIAEEITWEREISGAIEQQNWASLNSESRRQAAVLQELSSSLQHSMEQFDWSVSRERLHTVLRSRIVQEVYHRDVVSNLQNTVDMTMNVFNWQRVLKYCMDIQTMLMAKMGESDASEDPSTDASTGRSADDILMRGTLKVTSGFQFGECRLSQMDSVFPYDLEYGGGRARLVMTPLTERAHIGLTRALRSFESAALVAPTGSGKSALVTDLALAMGRHLVEVTCNDSLPVSLLRNFLCGMLASSSWLLFSEVHRLPIGLLAVLGNYLDTISIARRVLASSRASQYTTRGQPHANPKVTLRRRNSVTTLHSLAGDADDDADIEDDRRTSRRCGGARERRHSIERDHNIREDQLYQHQPPPPLFYDHMRQLKRMRRQLKASSPSVRPPVDAHSHLGSLLFDGELVIASASSACFFTATRVAMTTAASIPENFRQCLRVCSLVKPDIRSIAEAVLLSEGFTQAATFASKLASFIKLLQLQLPRKPQYDFHLITVLTILREAKQRLAEVMRTNCIDVRKRSIHFSAVGESYGHPSQLSAPGPEALQEALLTSAIRSVLAPRLTAQTDLDTLQTVLRQVFAGGARPKSGGRRTHPAMVAEVRRQLTRDYHQAEPRFVDKVLELDEALHGGGRIVLLTGAAGSGKTVCYRALANALTALHDLKVGDKMAAHEVTLTPDKTLHHRIKQSPQLKILKDCQPLHAERCRRLWLNAVRTIAVTRTLQRLLHSVPTRPLRVSKVDVHVILPNALPPDQLIGWFASGVWHPGLLTRLLSTVTCVPPTPSHYPEPPRHRVKVVKSTVSGGGGGSSGGEGGTLSEGSSQLADGGRPSGTGDLSRWVVLDGRLDAGWLDRLDGALGGQLSLASADVVHIPESTTLILETADLADVSPVVLTKCRLVHCRADMLPWRAHTNAWCERAPQKWIVSNGWLKVMDNLMSVLFTPTIDFLNRHCSTSLRFATTGGATGYSTSGIVEVTTFLAILSALMDRHLLREKLERQLGGLSTTSLHHMSITPDLSRAGPSLSPSPSGSASSLSRRSRRRSSAIRAAETGVPYYMSIMRHMFTLAYVWGFGGALHDSCMDKFSEFVRQMLNSMSQPIKLPDTGSVFDYNVNCEVGSFVTWKDKSLSKVRSATNYTMVPEVERYHFLLDLLLPSSPCVILSGEPGVGKTSIIKNLLANRPSVTKLRLSPALTTQLLQAAILQRTSDQSPGMLSRMNLTPGPQSDVTRGAVPRERKQLFFIDDLNAAGPCRQSGSQTELLRQILSQKAVYSATRPVLTPVEDVAFVAAATAPAAIGSGAQCSRLDGRLLRLCHVLTVFVPSTAALLAIYSRGVVRWLEDFPPTSLRQPDRLAMALVEGLLSLFDRVRERLRPTPARPHYIFTLHNLSDVFSGLLLLSSRSCFRSTTGVTTLRPVLLTITRLWCHECTRVFTDRIVNTEDKAWFEKTLESVVYDYLCCDVPVKQTASVDLTSGQPSASAATFALDQTGAHHRGREGPADDDDGPTWHMKLISHQGSPPRTPSLLLLLPGQEGSEDSLLSENYKAFEQHIGFKQSDKEAMLHMDQIKLQVDSLLDFMFSRQIIHRGKETITSKVYTECGEGDVRDSLQRHLAAYRETRRDDVDLIFFREAVTRAAAMSRVLGITGGHAVLLSNSLCSGRKSLIRLTSFITNCKLFEPPVESDASRQLSILHDHMKRCSEAAAFQRQPVVLVVAAAVGRRCLVHVAAFMKDGCCPGLYSEEEEFTIASQMAHGQLKMKRRDKVDVEMTHFYERVTKNLHVFICADYDDEREGWGLDAVVSSLATVFTAACHVDVFTPWSQDAFVCIAKRRLRAPDTKLPAGCVELSRQLTSVIATAMAYIHLSCEAAVSIQRNATTRLFTPHCFRDFISMFHVVLAHIQRTTQAAIARYENGVSRIHDALRTIDAYRLEVALLMPEQKSSVMEIGQYIESIERRRKSYIEVLAECKQQEKDIWLLQKPLEELRQKSMTAINTFSPQYEAALATLNALEPGALDELRLYRAPPQQVKTLMEGICLIFDLPQNWDEARRLLARDLFERLQFYDKDSLADDLLARLQSMRRRVNAASLMSVSVAASSLASWLGAVCDYATVHRRMTAHRHLLAAAEDNMMKLEAGLGANRQKATMLKSVLEGEIERHKDACSHARTVERQIQSIERRVARSDELMTQMSAQLTQWRHRLRDARAHQRAAVTDALLAAAVISYHGPIHNRGRASLLTDWLRRCTLADFSHKHDFSHKVRRISVRRDTELSLRESSERLFAHIDHGGDYDVDDVSGGGGGGDDDDDDELTTLGEQMMNYGHEMTVHDSALIFSVQISEETVCVHNVPSVTSVADASAVLTADASAVLTADASAVLTADPSATDVSTAVSVAAVVSSVCSADRERLPPARRAFTPQSVLCLPGELSAWRLAGLPADVHSLHNALVMRAVAYRWRHRWPLLVDPDGVAELWVRGTLAGSERVRQAYDTSDDADELDIVAVEAVNLPPAESVTSAKRDVTERGSLGADVAVEGTHQLSVVTADDVALYDIFAKSVVDGFTLLVTDVEKTPLSSLYINLLLKRFITDEAGRRTVVVGDDKWSVHPHFNLFLSIAVPTHLAGEVRDRLPFHHFNVVDMSTSQEAIASQLLQHVMHMEKPEFEGHLRSLKNDLASTKQNMAKEQDALLSRILTMQRPLLEEKSLQTELQNFDVRVQQFGDLLEQTTVMSAALEERQRPFVAVGRLGSRLFEVAQRVCVLSPLYYVSLTTFVSEFRAAMTACHRGHGSAGEPSARARELMDAATRAACRSVGTMLGARHMTVFCALVALERMRIVHRGVTDREAAIFVRGVDTSAVRSEFSERPAWLANKVWLDCIALENTLPAVFKDLCQSLLKYSSQWQEYFKLAVSLVSVVPGENFRLLTILQKCLLWRVCAPERMSEVCESLIVHELGSVIEPPKTYDIQQVYADSSKCRPVLFLLPSERGCDPKFNSVKGDCLAAPLSEVRRLARAVDMSHRLHVITLGEPAAMTDIGHEIEKAMRDGFWVVLHNAHLAPAWTQHLLELFKDIVSDRPCGGVAGGSEASSERRKSESHSDARPTYVHPDFRLWLTTRPDFGTPLPGVLVQHSVKVSCEQKRNLRDTLQRSFKDASDVLRSASRAPGTWRAVQSQLVPLALLHAVLTHRQLHGTHGATWWTATQLAAAMAHVRVVLCAGKSGGSEWPTPGELWAAALGVGEVYADHCGDAAERDAVKGLATCLVRPTGASRGVEGLLRQLLPTASATYEQRVASVGERELDVDGFVTNRSLQHQSSLIVTMNLDTVMCSPHGGLPSLLYTHAEGILLTVLRTLSPLPPPAAAAAHPTTPPYPLDAFLRREAAEIASLIVAVRHDARLLHQVAAGRFAATSDTQRRLATVAGGGVPREWLGAGDSDREWSGSDCTAAAAWAQSLMKRARVLTGYVARASSTTTTTTATAQATDGGYEAACSGYDLGVFLRPDRFIETIRLDFVRRQFCDLHTTAINAQVVTDEIAAPPRGVRVCGLRLENAGWRAGHLTLDVGCASRTLPLVCLRPGPAMVALDDAFTFSCPVYARGVLVVTLSIASHHPSEVWTERNVYATCDARGDAPGDPS